MQYLQSRPSAAGTGYDPTASGASNLGPESIVDTLPDPSVKGDTGKQIAADPGLQPKPCGRQARRSDGARPFCTPSGVGAVLAVFYAGPGYQGRITRVVSVNEACPAKPFVATYQGVRVECATFGQRLLGGQGRADPRQLPRPIRRCRPTR